MVEVQYTYSGIGDIVTDTNHSDKASYTTTSSTSLINGSVFSSDSCKKGREKLINRDAFKYLSLLRHVVDAVIKQHEDKDQLLSYTNVLNVSWKLINDFPIIKRNMYYISCNYHFYFVISSIELD